MRIITYLCLYSSIGSFIISAMEQPLQTQLIKPEPCKAAFAHFPLLSLEIQTYIPHFITAATPKDALQKLKAYLSANKELRTFYHDESYIQKLLLAWQKRFKTSQLELARILASPASKRNVEKLSLAGETSWHDYLKGEHSRAKSYGEFIFETRKDAQNIPSLLYYVYSNPSYFDRAKAQWGTPGAFITQTIRTDTYKRINYWIESGLVNQQYQKLIWTRILSPGDIDMASSMIVAQILINAGYINITLDPQSMYFTRANVTRLNPSLLDYVTNKIQLYMDKMGTANSQEITKFYTILRLLIKAGAKSSYELEQP